MFGYSAFSYFPFAKLLFIKMSTVLWITIFKCIWSDFYKLLWRTGSMVWTQLVAALLTSRSLTGTEGTERTNKPQVSLWKALTCLWLDPLHKGELWWADAPACNEYHRQHLHTSSYASLERHNECQQMLYTKKAILIEAHCPSYIHGACTSSLRWTQTKKDFQKRHRLYFSWKNYTFRFLEKLLTPITVSKCCH